MPLLGDSFVEMIVLAATPEPTGAGADAAGAVEQAHRSPVHAAIGEAVDDARRTGRRAAVCVVDLPRHEAPGHPDAAAIDAAVAGGLRRADRHGRVGGVLVIVAPSLDHPGEGDRLAERLRAFAGGLGGVVGLALYPVHGHDAVALLDSARASALRSRLGRARIERAAAATRPAE